MGTSRQHQFKSNARPKRLPRSLLLAFFSAPFLTGCIDTYGVRQLELEKTDLIALVESTEHRISNLEKNIAGLQERSAEPLAIRDWIELNLKERSEIQNRITALEQNLTDSIAVLKFCQGRFKSKILLELGTTFESITLNNGREYKKVTATSFDGDNLTLTHSGGIVRAAVAALPDDLAQLFVLPPSALTDIQALQAVFDRKPESLMTASQRADVAARQGKAQVAAAEKNLSTLRTENESNRNRMEADDVARAKISMERDASRKRISDQIARMNQSKEELTNGRMRVQSEFSQRKIPLSAQDQARQLKVFDDKIASINAAILDLERELK